MNLFLKLSSKAGQILKTKLVLVFLLSLILSLTVFKITSAEQVLIAERYNIIGKGLVISDRMALLAFSDGDPQALVGKLNAFPVTVTVGGSSSIVEVAGGTVKDVLAIAKVEVGMYDKVSLPLDTKVCEFDDIVITRRERLVDKQETTIPHQTYYRHSPDVSPGDEVVETQGISGTKTDSYEKFYVGGEIDEEKLLESKITTSPIDKVILIGFLSRPVSALDFDANFDQEGDPVDYSRVIRSARAAGYSAPAGAGTASGLPAMVGHVAVNPQVIPYGSKLFIQSADGKFVYGYAIAADTGTALTKGIIAVDLFYGSYQESANNGIKDVDIFVLEEGSKK